MGQIWCGIRLYQHQAAAEAALRKIDALMPVVTEAEESWHAVAMPIHHHGQTNWLDGAIDNLFTTHSDPLSNGDDAPLMVMTTAGFHSDQTIIQRVSDFIDNLADVRESMHAQPGLRTQQAAFNVAGRNPIEDGITLSIWDNEALMKRFAYRPGRHRQQIERFKRENLQDRSSFTRFRMLESIGSWYGRDLLEC